MSVLTAKRTGGGGTGEPGGSPANRRARGEQVARDLVLHRLREQLAEADRALVAAFERRVKLVLAVRERKADLGVPFVDPAQEERLVERLVAGREGTSSAGGVRDLARTVLVLSRREAARSAAGRCESVAEQVA